MTRLAFKGMFWLALVLIPLGLIAFPSTIMAFGAWLLNRFVGPRRPAHTPTWSRSPYAVSSATTTARLRRGA